MWKHLFKTSNLLLRVMAAVVDQYIEKRYGLSHRSPKCSVALVTNKNFYAICFVNLTSGFNIDAEYLAFVPKILSPHLETAAAVDPNLHYMNIGADKFF